MKMNGIKPDCDVIIIGGGAAGLCAAVRLKKNLPHLKVVLLEQLPRVGKKLIVTGNGRCNITNREIRPERYHGAHPGFCLPALKKYGGARTEEFFSSVGVVITYDETGRGYPYSLQASSVVDALRFAAAECGADVRCDCAVSDFKRENGIFSVKTADGAIVCRYLIAAGGMYSGGDKLGSTGALFGMFRKKGYPTVAPAPAIVQLKTDPATVRPLKGIKVNAAAALLKDGKAVRRESGEVLFCDYGLSGPPILQLSRAAGRNERGLEISLDLMPQYDGAETVRLLSSRVSDIGERPAEEFFTGLLNKRVGQTLLKLCKISGRVQNGDIKALSRMIHSWKFPVSGTTGFINSQVTSGGLDTSAFSAETMESLRDRGLYAAGEILDIDGDCGGFNLQWAWSSAMAAADAIIQKETEK